MATFYLDPEGGNDSNDGTTFANRWKTIISGATAARIAAGDIIRVIANPPETDTGINATFTDLSATVTLASALNTLITDCESAWTASANVTCTTSATRKNGTVSASIAIAAGFTTGKVAYFDLGSSQNYSAYEGITFWVNQNAAIAAGVLQIKLCSDTTGDTPVDTLNFPDCFHANGTLWTPVYIDKGSALGSSIRTIALYAASDPGTITVLLDNISTVKAKGSSQTDNLNLNSLVSAGASGPWYVVRSINGTAVTLDDWPGGVATTTPRGWCGTTGSYDFYKLEPIRYYHGTGSAGTNVLQVQDTGTSANRITFSGGWNRSDMSVQNGESWLDGINGWYTGLGASLKSYISIEKINLCRWYYAGQIGSLSDNWIVSEAGTIKLAGNQNYHFSVVGANNTILGNVEMTGGGTAGIQLSSAYKVTIGDVLAHGTNPSFTGGGSLTLLGTNRFIKIGDIDQRNMKWFGFYYETVCRLVVGNITSQSIENYVFGSTTFGRQNGVEVGNITHTGYTAQGVVFHPVQSWGARFGDVSVTGGTRGIQNNAGPGSFIKSITTSGNSTAGWDQQSNAVPPCRNRIKSVNCTDTTPFRDSGFSNLSRTFSPTYIRHYQGTTDAHRTWIGNIDGATTGPFARITVETGANRHTASGKGWKWAALSTAPNVDFPVRYTLGRVYVTASSQVTLRLWVNRSNTGLGCKLVMPKNQIAGVTSDQVDTAAASASTWEELEVLFTPSENGIVAPEIWVWTSDASYFMYFDDMTCSQ